jgi:hypothetical protein
MMTYLSVARSPPPQNGLQTALAGGTKNQSNDVQAELASRDPLE